MQVRLSALFPITSKDVERLHELQKQINPSTETELWDALDTIISKMNRELNQIKKGRAVYNCVRIAQKSGYIVRTSTGFKINHNKRPLILDIIAESINNEKR